MTSAKDIKCDVRKNQMSHWILKGVKHEFICENTNEWDPHPVSMTNTDIVVTSQKLFIKAKFYF